MANYLVASGSRKISQLEVAGNPIPAGSSSAMPLVIGDTFPASNATTVQIETETFVDTLIFSASKYYVGGNTFTNANSFTGNNVFSGNNTFTGNDAVTGVTTFYSESSDYQVRLSGGGIEMYSAKSTNNFDTLRLTVSDGEGIIFQDLNKSTFEYGEFLTVGHNQGRVDILRDTHFSSDVVITGSLTVKDVFYVFETASFLNSSGSTIFGDTIDDEHQFTGSIYLSGSLAIVAGGLLDGVDLSVFSSSVQTESSSFASRVSAQENFSGSQYNTDSSSFEDRITENSQSLSLLSGSFLTDSGSFSTRITDIEIFSASVATTGSNVFVGDQIITDGEFNVTTGSGQLTSSLSFTHNITGPDDGNAILELRHNNEVYNDNFAVQLKTDYAGAYLNYEENGTPYSVLSVQSFVNKNIYIHRDTRLFQSSLRIDNNLTVTGSLLSSASAYFLGNVTASVFTGSFVGDGTGLGGVTAAAVDFGDITNKPTLISQSQQVNADNVTNFDSNVLTYINSLGSISSSQQVNADNVTNFDANVLTYNNSLGVVSSSQQINADNVTNFDANVLAYNNSLGVVSGSSQVVFNNVSLNPFVSTSAAISASNHFVPSDNEVYDLGTPTQRWRDLYLSGSTIDLGGLLIQRNADGNVQFIDSASQEVKTVGLQSATDNIVIGDSAGSQLTTGTDNTLVGKGAGANIAAASVGNTALGSSIWSYSSASPKDVGNWNVAIGYYSQERKEEGAENTSVGVSTLRFNYSGSGNTTFGYQSLSGIATFADYNTAIGHRAGHSLVSGNRNIFIGAGATSGPTNSYSNMIVIGSGSIGMASNTTTIGNDAITHTYIRGIITGSSVETTNLTTTNLTVLSNSISSSFVTASKVFLEEGTGNISIGKDAHQDLASGGNYNVAIGRTAGATLTTGDNNTAIGYQSLGVGASALTGNYNTAVGSTALRVLEAGGGSNTAIGYGAGNNITSGSQNTLIGYLADTLNVGDSNSIVIGYNATGYGSNTVSIGNATTTNTYFDTRYFTIKDTTASGPVRLTLHNDTDTDPVVQIDLQRGANDTWGSDAYRDWRIQNDGGEFSIIRKETGNPTNGIASLRFDVSDNLHLSASITEISNNLNVTGSVTSSGFNVVSAGSIGVVLNQDTSNAGVSSRIHFLNQDGGFAIMNESGRLSFRSGSIPGQTSGVEKARLLANNDFELTTGNFKVASGAGIDFSNTSDAAGMTSELLDDYEEGTWTPVIRGDATAGTYELAASYAHYTKIGAQVTLTAQIQLAGSITGGGSGYLQITGAPFTKANNMSFVGATSLVGVDFTGQYVSVKFVSVSSTAVLFLAETVDNGASVDLPISSIAANDQIAFTITYFV